VKLSTFRCDVRGIMDLIKEARTDGADQPTLLIIDDDAEWTDILKMFFLDKYRVEVINTACDAIEVARKHQPHVIILDLVMPSVDGFGVIHRLNDSGERRIPTILVTGWKTAEVEECAAAIGCAAVLSKPIDLGALDAVVSSVVNGSSATSAAVM
jgi:two-component system, response regulator, stage 0 sporulation protein A